MTNRLKLTMSYFIPMGMGPPKLGYLFICIFVQILVQKFVMENIPVAFFNTAATFIHNLLLSAVAWNSYKFLSVWLHSHFLRNLSISLVNCLLSGNVMLMYLLTAMFMRQYCFVPTMTTYIFIFHNRISMHIFKNHI